MKARERTLRAHPARAEREAATRIASEPPRPPPPESQPPVRPPSPPASTSAGKRKAVPSATGGGGESASPKKKRLAADAEASPAAKRATPPATEEVVITRPAAMQPGDEVEALDVQDLWYPARIVQCTATQVLVHFDGWGSGWDEWLPHNSKRLRAHRGWGTARMPDDYQVGATIEALDVVGKWCASKVLHVAESGVMVHYLQWASKWDEWIDRSTGRLRPLRDGGAARDRVGRLVDARPL